MRLPRLTIRKLATLVAGVAVLLAAFVEWPRWQRRRAIADLQARLARPMENPQDLRNETPLFDFVWYLNSGMDPKNCIAVAVEPKVYKEINTASPPISIGPDEYRLPIKAILQRKLEPLGLTSEIRDGRLVIFVEP